VLRRFFFFLLAVVAIVMVSQPDWATGVANFLGVGGGIDLIAYCLIFLWLGSYSHVQEMDAHLTKLTQDIDRLGAKK
jgi:hypothetical protein